MRLQVRYPSGQAHEVELAGRVSIVGRDPSCDLVVNDVKCSRRHAVLETGPDGVAIRDSGSANGVFVNGQRVERAILRAGDVVSMGEVQLTLLPEAGAGTEVTLVPPAASRAASAPTSPSSAPPAPPPARAAAPLPRPTPPPTPLSDPARPRGSYRLSGSTDSGEMKVGALKEDMAAEAVAARATARPLTATVLAALWMASVIVYAIGGVVAVVAGGGIAGGLAAAFGLMLAAVGAVMGLGLWMVKPWARIAQIVIAALGLLTCSFTLASGAVLFYMFRPAVRARFAAGQGPGDPKEGLFTGILLGTVALGAVVTLGLWALIALGFAGGQIP